MSPMSYQTAPPRGPNKIELYTIVYLLSNEKKQIDWNVGFEGLGCWGNGEMGRWGGGHMNGVMNGYMIAWLWGELGYGVMEDWMNEVMFAWPHSSRYSSTGKNRNLNIPVPKVVCNPILLIIQGPMNLPPHSPISPSPHASMHPCNIIATLLPPQ
jgi:hypothetical protein